MISTEPSLRRRRRRHSSSITPEQEARLQKLRVALQIPSFPEPERTPDNIVSLETKKRLSKLTPEMETRLRLLKEQRPRASYRELGISLQTPSTTVAYWIKRLGLPHRPARRGRASKLTAEMEERLRVLKKERPLASCRELGIELHTPTPTVENWIRRLGLPHRHHRKLTPEIEAQLRILKAEQPFAGYQNLAIKLHAPVSTVALWIKQLGLPHYGRRKLTLEMEERLRSLKVEMPTAGYAQLAIVLQIPVGTVASWIKRLGLPHHSISVPATKLTPEVEKHLRTLISANPLATYKELGIELQTSLQTVASWIKRLGLPHQQVRRGPASKLTPEMEKRMRTLISANPLATYKELGIALQTSIPNVARWSKRLGLPHRESRGIQSTITPAHEAKLRRLIAKNPLVTLNELARSIGNIVSRQTIRNWCSKFNIPYTGGHYGRSSKLTPEMEKRLQVLKAAKPLANYTELGRELQAPPTTVAGWVERLGLPHRVIRPSKLTPEMETRLRKLKEEFPSAGYKKLAKALHVPPTTVVLWIKRLGLHHRAAKGTERSKRIKRHQSEIQRHKKTAQGKARGRRKTSM